MFCIKVDSSLGRVLIYKLSFQILKDNYLLGIGIGKFNPIYMEYQARYFATGHYTTKELLLADNVLYAYNDYLQFIISTGVCGMLLLFVYFLWVWVVLKRIILQAGNNSYVVLLATVVFISPSVAACFTFVFERLAFQIVFIIAITVLCYYEYFAYNKGILKFVPFVVFTLLSLVVLKGYKERLIYFDAYSKFSETKDLSGAGFKTESLSNLQELYPRLKSDPDYLWFYGTELMNKENYGQAIVIFNYLSEIKKNNSLYAALGKCYSAQGNLVKAEASFIKSINMVPNRFGYRFELYKFYIKVGMQEKAKEVRREILRLPVKVRSGQVDFIRKQVSTIKAFQ